MPSILPKEKEVKSLLKRGILFRLIATYTLSIALKKIFYPYFWI